MKKIITTLAIVSFAITGYATAEQTITKTDNPQNTKSIQSQNSNNSSEMQKELSNSMMTMHKNMEPSLAIKDPDIAFAKGMIAHHLGAIDMAKVELKYGTDPEMKKLAQQIIDAQGPEIKLMQQWLETKNK